MTFGWQTIDMEHVLQLSDDPNQKHINISFLICKFRFLI